MPQVACERRRLSGCRDSLRRKMRETMISTAGNTSAFAGYASSSEDDKIIVRQLTGRFATLQFSRFAAF